MEVYKITNKINHKVYIGSTQYTKEERWNGTFPSAHLTYAKNGNTAPLYEDIRKYGSESFELSTIELYKNNEITRNELYKREDYWIKKYWNNIGSDMMYNQVPSAKATNDGHQLITNKARNNRNSTMINKYNTLFYISDDKIKQRNETSKQNNSGIYSEKAFNNRSTDFIYNGNHYYGVTNLKNELVKEGYDLTWNQVQKLSLYGYFSKNNKKKYPELINSIKIIRYNKLGKKSRNNQ